jgi:predicted transcriptional regulator
MAKKRERLEVIHDILKVVQDHGNSVLPTKLLHSSNLSPQMFKEYVDELLAKGMLGQKDISGKRHYSLTTKGFEFLAQYKTITEFIENFGL